MVPNDSIPALVTRISIGPSSARTACDRGVDRGPVAHVDHLAEHAQFLGEPVSMASAWMSQAATR